MWVSFFVNLVGYLQWISGNSISISQFSEVVNGRKVFLSRSSAEDLRNFSGIHDFYISDYVKEWTNWKKEENVTLWRRAILVYVG